MTKLIKLLMVVCLFIAVQSGLYAKYICIIDAGSSGSRIWLYNVEFDSAKGTVNAAEIALDKSKSKTKPGIAAFANVDSKKIQTEIANYFAAMLGEVTEKAKAAGCDPKTIPIYLLATAGMRIVSPTDQTYIYSELIKYLSTTGFIVDEKSSAKTISGEMEGVFDWLAVNWKNNISRANNPTLGVMDMGGASMQVVYATPMNSGKGIQPVKIGDIDPIKYNVYSKSYLGLGADYARYQYSDDLNCFFKGFYTPGKGGNYGSGLVDVDRLLTSVARLEPIPFDKMNAPMEFCAISAFNTIAKSEHFKFNTTMSIPEMVDKGNVLAENTWQSLEKEAQSNPYLFSLMFTSQHIIEVLRDLGFTDDKKIQLSDASWPIGAAIYLAYNNTTLQQGVNLVGAEQEQSGNLAALQGGWDSESADIWIGE